MSRLHSLRATIDGVARFLDAEPVGQITLPPDVTEGRQGLVMFGAGGRRRLRMMRWGFPVGSAARSCGGTSPRSSAW